MNNEIQDSSSKLRFFYARSAFHGVSHDNLMRNEVAQWLLVRSLHEEAATAVK